MRDHSPVPVRWRFGLTMMVAPNPANFGDQVAYTITIQNAGPDSSPVTMSMAIDDGLVLIAAGADGGGLCNELQQLQCLWPNVDPGATVQAVVTAQTVSSGLILELATASVGPDILDPNPSNNADDVMLNVLPSTGAAQSDLAVTKRAIPDQAYIGAPVSFLITLTNNGPDYAGGPIEIRDQLASGLTFVSAAANGGGTCTLISSEVRCSWSGLAVGKQVAASILVRPELAGFYTNNVAVTQVNEDPDPSNNQPEAELLVRAPDLLAGAQCRVKEQLSDGSGSMLPRGGLQYGGASAWIEQPGEAQLLHASLILDQAREPLLPMLDGAPRLVAVSRAGGRSVLASAEPVMLGETGPARLFLIDEASPLPIALPDLLGGAVTPTVAFAGDGGALLFVGPAEGGSGSRLGRYDFQTGQVEILQAWAVPVSAFERLLASVDLLQAAVQVRADLDADLVADSTRVYRLAANASQRMVGQAGAELGGMDGQGQRLAFTDGGALWIDSTSTGSRMLVADGATIRSPLLSQNGSEIYYLEAEQGGALALRQTRVADLSTVTLMLLSSPLGADDRLIAHDGTGQSFLLRHQSGLLSGVSADSSEIYLIDCDSIRAGAWHDPNRNGHGWDIQRIRDELVSLWFNYRQDGSANWQIGSGVRQGRSWEADLLQVSYDFSDGSRDPQSIGALYLLFADSHNGVAHWTIGGVSRFEPINFLLFDKRVPAVDMTAVWYDPEDPGWGVSVSHQGQIRYALVYVYGQDGEARWVDGVSVDGAQTLQAQLFQGFGLCPIGCPDSAPLPFFQNAGSFQLQFGTPGTLPTATQLVSGDALLWLKAMRALQPLSDPVP